MIAAPLMAAPLMVVTLMVVTLSASICSPRLFGTLQSDPSRLKSNYDAGVRLAHVELDWSRYEPEEGQFDLSYINSIKGKIQKYRAAGLKLSLGHGIHYTPRWVLDLQGADYINQHGVSTKGPNIVFSQAVREKAETYFRRVARDVGTDFYSIRIEVAPYTGEMLYPDGDDDAGHSNSLWAYDQNAQGQGNDMSSNVAATPYPGWKPGMRTYKGRAFTEDQVERWYNWYIEALVRAGDWQVKSFKGLGHTGKMAWLLPGPGMRPFDYRRYVANYLTGDNGYDEFVGSRAAVWDKVIDSIVDKSSAQIQITSLADPSGSPWGNGCKTADREVDIYHDAVISAWSGARWIAYNADRWGLPKSGENPGPHDSREIMNRAASQMVSCNLEAWYYAFERSLYDDYPEAATINDYAQVIARLSSR